MYRFFLIALLFVSMPLPQYAQGTFMDQLTRVQAGKGRVTVNQDPRLTAIINGNGQPPLAAPPAPASTSTADKLQPTHQDDTDVTAPVIHTGKRVKVRGFRIQVFWGGSQRTEQAKAIQAGNKVSALFPEYQTYTSFESPHWRCRVGDFLDRQDAWEALQRLREAGIGANAMIVRSEVYTYQ